MYSYFYMPLYIISRILFWNLGVPTTVLPSNKSLLSNFSHYVEQSLPRIFSHDFLKETGAF